MNFQNTMRKVYAGIVAIPLGAILLASAIGGSGGNTYDYRDYDLDDTAAASQENGGFAGSGLNESEAYESLEHLNPCIFIECEGESE